MSGANLLVVCVRAYTPSGAPALSDTSSNTWFFAASSTEQPNSNQSLWEFYAYKATTTASQMISISGGVYGIAAFGFSGVSTSSPLDIATGSASTSSVATAIQAGAVTPSQDGDLLVACEQDIAAVQVVSIDSSFTMITSSTYAGGVNYGDGSAYYVQPTAGSINPTWTNSVAALTATIGAFKASGGAAPSSTPVTPMDSNFFASD